MACGDGSILPDHPWRGLPALASKPRAHFLTCACHPCVGAVIGRKPNISRNGMASQQTAKGKIKLVGHVNWIQALECCPRTEYSKPVSGHHWTSQSSGRPPCAMMGRVVEGPPFHNNALLALRPSEGPTPHGAPQKPAAGFLLTVYPKAAATRCPFGPSCPSKR